MLCLFSYIINLMMDLKKTKKEKKMADKVNKEMSILDIVQKFPQSLEVFSKYGLGCIGCAAARFENLEAGARVHGFDPDEMVKEINALIED